MTPRLGRALAAIAVIAGLYCFVSVARKDRVSVISFASGKEVARIPVGFHPQRMRTGRARADLL